ncbi:hypothetical protein ACYF6T_37220 [Streptomyces sp. 7R007]
MSVQPFAASAGVRRAVLGRRLAVEADETRRRLVGDVLDVGQVFPLVLAGDDAARVHGLVDGAGGDVEVVTESAVEMAGIADAVRAGLAGRGWLAEVTGADPLSARLVVTDAGTGEKGRVGVAKEVLWHPPVPAEPGLALSLDDVVGIKVRALADYGLARDLVDVRAAAEGRSLLDLEELGRRHARDSFDLADLQARLDGVEWVDDREFTACGLGTDAVPDLRRWAQQWSDDIAERLLEAQAPEED